MIDKKNCVILVNLIPDAIRERGVHPISHPSLRRNRVPGVCQVRQIGKVFFNLFWFAAPFRSLKNFGDTPNWLQITNWQHLI